MKLRYLLKLTSLVSLALSLYFLLSHVGLTIYIENLGPSNSGVLNLFILTPLMLFINSSCCLFVDSPKAVLYTAVLSFAFGLLPCVSSMVLLIIGGVSSTGDMILYVCLTVQLGISLIYYLKKRRREQAQLIAGCQPTNFEK